MAIYLKNSVFTKHYNDSLTSGQCTKEFLSDFFLLAENIYKTLGRETDMDRSACINYAVTEAWQKWIQYDPKKSPNIFAFFTSMISNDIKIHYNYLNRIGNRSISLTLFENNNEA